MLTRGSHPIRSLFGKKFNEKHCFMAVLNYRQKKSKRDRSLISRLIARIIIPYITEHLGHKYRHKLNTIFFAY